MQFKLSLLLVVRYFLTDRKDTYIQVNFPSFFIENFLFIFSHIYSLFYQPKCLAF